MKLSNLRSEEKWFVIVALGLWLLPLGAYLISRDNIESDLRRLSSSDAIDCGTGFSSMTDESAVAKTDDCVVAAVQAHKPFRARYDEEFVEDMWRTKTIVSTGIVGTDKGQVCFLYDKHNPCSWPFGRQYICPKLIIQTDGWGHQKLECQSDGCSK